MKKGCNDLFLKKDRFSARWYLADEINRATPKTQSALLEAMGEKTVTVLGETRKMATTVFRSCNAKPN